MQWCFNEHKDVPVDIKDFVDNASGGQFNNLTIDEINDFLTSYDAFCNQDMAYPNECVVSGPQPKIIYGVRYDKKINSKTFKIMGNK